MLKLWYEKESDIPEANKALYAEKELELKKGEPRKVWVLQVEGAIPKEIHQGFRDNNITLTQENNQLKERYAGIDDADKARALLKIAKDVEVDDAEKYLKKGGVDAMIAERTKAMREDLEGKLNTEKTARTKAEQLLDREMINNTILAACRTLELQPGAETMILKIAEGQWSRKDGRIVSLDANGNPKSNKDGTGDLAPTEWLQETLLKQHPYLVKESSGGGAAGGGSGGTSGQSHVNPFKKGPGFNMTEQAKIMKADPARALRLQQQAKSAA